ncbi:MAG: endonuclease/exonuclease/phosphatase family protein [Armatimonadetes bacterium]|nr:endonuclease/exonuclease/phosphatase family protein [Armatimonadota bacterium]
MADLCVAFWNVYNLFVPGAVGRGPVDDEAYQAKLAATARVIAGLAQGGPHVAALAEVGSPRAADDLLRALRSETGNGSLQQHHVPSVDAGHSGLTLVWDPLRVTVDTMGIEVLDGVTRPFAAWAPCELILGGAFSLVCNHWKSDYRNEGDSAMRRRLATAQAVRAKLDATAPDTPVILVGDFNAEPDQPELSPLGARRFHSQAREARAGGSAHVGTLYNTAWRFMAEPDPWDVASGRDYRASRPRGSWFGSSPPRLLDHVVVSKGAMHPPVASLLESRLRYYTDQYAQSGHLTALPESDHLPVVAWFRLGA